jgi:hypothetical protein
VIFHLIVSNGNHQRRGLPRRLYALVRISFAFFYSRIRGALENQRILPQFSHSSVTGLDMDTAKTMLNGRVRVNRAWSQWLHLISFPVNSYSAGVP